MSHLDTIVAAATPPVEGGIGIIRVSGPIAETLLLLYFKSIKAVSSLESHRLYLGRFESQQGVFIDEVMAVIMRAPRSYTREDVVEVHCHGGLIVMRQIIDLFIDAGARLARPGEFTLRAFLNGRLDLSQAEAVIDLIRSRSDSASRLATAQLQGSVYRVIQEFQSQLVNVLSLVEAHIDFPEEDIDFSTREGLLAGVLVVSSRIDDLLLNFDAGRVLREGLSVLILGKPNVGKSSLLNALLGESRAIVTDIPGTTRDIIEERLVLAGIPLHLIDTAGVRVSVDPIEAEGIRRAEEKIASADLILLVIDSSRPVDSDDVLALNACVSGNVLLVRSKSDLGDSVLDSRFGLLSSVKVSTRTGVGMANLQTAIIHSVCGDFTPGDASMDVIFSDRRHREALVLCYRALERFVVSLQQGVGLEFLATDLREALSALGEISGETTPDHVLDRIFSRFCIGK